MPSILITAGGKYILAGALGFLTAAPGAGGGSTPPADPGPQPTGPSNISSLSLTDFVSTSGASAFPVVQRSALSMQDPGGPWANVPVLCTVTTSDGNPPANLQARVVNAKTGAAVKDWAALQDISVVGNAVLGTLPKVKQGGYYLLQVRDGNNTATVSNGAQQWGVGVVVLMEGQSNMVSTMAMSYTEIVPGTSQNEFAYWNSGAVAGALFSTSGWVKPSGPINSNIDSASGGVLKFLRLTAKALADKYGYPVPVALIPYAHNNKGISVFRPGGPAYECLFNGVPSSGYAGTVSFKSPKNVYAGDYEVVVLHQGEADSGATMTKYLRRDALIGYYQDHLNYVAPFGRDASTLFFLPAILGSYGSPSVYYIESIRLGVLELETYAKANGWPNVIPAWNCIDLDASLDTATGGLHFSQANIPSKDFSRWSFMRMLQSVLFKLGCASYSGTGPRVDLSDITRSGNVITIGVKHERAGAVLRVRDAANPPTGVAANSAEDFSGVDIPVSLAIVNGKLAATLALPNGVSYASGVYIKVLGGRIGYANSYRPAIDNLPCDDSAVPSTAAVGDQVLGTVGLPIMPTDAIKVN